MTFPTHRPRRLRRSEAMRGLVRETQVSAHGLVYPMFACPGTKVRTEVSSMPGIFQQSPDQIVEECREVAGLGIPAVILFGLPEHKDETGSEAADPNAAVQRSCRITRCSSNSPALMTTPASSPPRITRVQFTFAIGFAPARAIKAELRTLGKAYRGRYRDRINSMYRCSDVSRRALTRGRMSSVAT